MDDTTAQQPFNPSQPPATSTPPGSDEPVLSYVDNYAPPSFPPAMNQPAASSLPPMPPASSSMAGMPPNSDFSPTPTPPVPTPNPVSAPMMSQPANQLDAQDLPEAPAPKAAGTTGQALEEQNIFDMLGAGEASEEEKEAFLDELQQVIWEDFLENDVELLITEPEKVELKQIQDKSYPSDLEKQEAIVVYLEKLIPDLEDIMLEKALELKRDMFMERLAGMKDTLAGQTDKLSAISTVENLVSQDKWSDAVKSLNQLA